MEDLVNTFEEHNILLDGHFVLTSGKHAKQYINKDRIFSIPSLFKDVINKIIDVTPYISDAHIITGPAIAGAVLASNVAMKTNKIFIYPEKINSKMVFRRGYDKLIKGKYILIVEDIITTGGSVNKTIKAVNELGGIVVGVSCIWNRSNWSALSIPMINLINKKVESWPKTDCPMCKRNISFTNPKTGEIEK